jgi:putative acetyltransferase
LWVSGRGSESPRTMGRLNRCTSFRRGGGVGAAILRHIMADAKAKGVARLSLETGVSDYFKPAVALYRRHGFVECPPFADYAPDPHSLFMTCDLAESA